LNRPAPEQARGQSEKGAGAMALVNRQTGKAATPAEQAACERRALEILRNPYASPELLEWAMEIAPQGLEAAFWESCRKKAEREWREKGATYE